MGSNTAIEFGYRLAEERRRLGLTQAEFAKDLGIDPSKQSLYETGVRDLRAGYLASVAAVGVDVMYVLTGQRLNTKALPEAAAVLLNVLHRLPPHLQEDTGRFVGSVSVALAAAAKKSKRGRSVH